MNDLSQKKLVLENTGEKPFYSINSFRGFNVDRHKQTNEIKINNSNLTSRIIFEINKNTNIDKSRTMSKNKFISNKMQSVANIQNKTNK